MDDVSSIAPALDEDDINLPYLFYEQEVNGSFQHRWSVQDNPYYQYPDSRLLEQEDCGPDLGSTWSFLQNDGTGNDIGTFGDQTANHSGPVQLPGSRNDSLQPGGNCDWHQYVILHSSYPHSGSKKDE